MKMPNLSACAGSCFLVESHVAIEAAIEKRAAASEACDSSLRFPLSSNVFILLFQRSVCCLSVPEHALDVSIYFLRPSKNLLTVRSSANAECFGRRIGIVCFDKDRKIDSFPLRESHLLDRVTSHLLFPRVFRPSVIGRNIKAPVTLIIPS
jgi:hypothetical protein